MQRDEGGLSGPEMKKPRRAGQGFGVKTVEGIHEMDTTAGVTDCNVQPTTGLVIPFLFERQEVRTLLIDDQPWFVAKDIVCSLGYAKSSSPAKLIEHVPEQWKGVNPIHTLGGTQRVLMLSEQGLYFFLGRSDKPKALPVQMWVAGEVLPAIRKHGRYEDTDSRLATLVGQTIGTDGFHCLAAVVDGKTKRLPAALRRGAKNHLWSQVHKAFSVVTAEDIPANQLDAARNFVAAYALEGEWLGRDALEGFGGLIGKKLKGSERWMVSVDHTGQEQYTPIPENASVLSYEDLIAGMVSTRGDIPVSTDEMFEFMMAALTNLKCRTDHMQHMLRVQRASH